MWILYGIIQLILAYCGEEDGLERYDCKFMAETIEMKSWMELDFFQWTIVS